MIMNATAKNLAIAVVAGVAAMLIYDTIKKRAATSAAPAVKTSTPKVVFPGGITVETPIYAQAPAQDAEVGPSKPIWI